MRNMFWHLQGGSIQIVFLLNLWLFRKIHQKHKYALKKLKNNLLITKVTLTLDGNH